MTYNGSVIGKLNTPTISTSSGRWGLESQYRAQSLTEWPIPPGSISPDVLLYSSFNGTSGDTAVDVYSGDGSSLPVIVSNGMTATGGSNLSNAYSKVSGFTTSAYTPSAGSDYWGSITSVTNNLKVGSTSPISFEFWWYNGGSVSGSYGRLLTFDGYSTSGTGIEIESNGTNTSSWIFYEYSGSAGARSSRGTYTLATNNWHHIYWAIDPTGGSSYVGINGTVSSFSNYLSNFSPTRDLFLGGNDIPNNGSSGYFQNLIVRNTIPYTSNFTPSTLPISG